MNAFTKLTTALTAAFALGGCATTGQGAGEGFGLGNVQEAFKSTVNVLNGTNRAINSGTQVIRSTQNTAKKIERLGQ